MDGAASARKPKAAAARWANRLRPALVRHERRKDRPVNANEAARPGGGKAPPAISVVVPAMNEEGTIRAALQPLMEESVPGGLEIIVAVAPSMDQTRAAVEEIARRDPRMRLVDNHARATPVGLNLAIAASRGDVILRMDGHAIPGPGYVAACLAVLESSGAWNVGGEIRKVGRTPSARAAAAATSSSFGIGGGRRFHLAKKRPTWTLSGRDAGPAGSSIGSAFSTRRWFEIRTMSLTRGFSTPEDASASIHRSRPHTRVGHPGGG